MQELTLSELEIVSGGMHWKGREESDNVWLDNQIGGQSAWLDNPANKECAPTPPPDNDPAVEEDGS